MKKLTILLVFLFLFACSKDNQQPIDPIVGVWKMTFVIVDGEIFKDYINVPCYNQSTWAFAENFDYNAISYSGDSGNCIMNSAQALWSKNAGQYEINNVPKEIVFPDKNTMYWMYEPDPDKDTYWQFERIN